MKTIKPKTSHVILLLTLVTISLLSAAAAHAQSRADVGMSIAGDRDRGYRDQSVSLSGRVVFKFGSMALDGNADWVFHAPKIGSGAPDGKTITTAFFLRRYLFGPMYIVAGVDLNKLSSVLLNTTATSAATGVGLEAGNFRLQGIYEPPDFTSGQSLSHYRAEGEYTLPVGKHHYVSFRPRATVVRFSREGQYQTLIAERVGLTVSFGRFF